MNATQSDDQNKAIIKKSCQQQSHPGFISPANFPPNVVAVTYCDTFASFTFEIQADGEIDLDAYVLRRCREITYTYLYVAK